MVLSLDGLGCAQFCVVENVLVLFHEAWLTLVVGGSVVLHIPFEEFLPVGISDRTLGHSSLGYRKSPGRGFQLKLVPCKGRDLIEHLSWLLRLLLLH